MLAVPSCDESQKHKEVKYRDHADVVHFVYRGDYTMYNALVCSLNPEPPFAVFARGIFIVDDTPVTCLLCLGKS